MPRNKPRLQLALYARPKHPDSYHYALLVCPKTGLDPITKHHVKNTLQVQENGQATTPWRYECLDIADPAAEPRLLVRTIIAKVKVSRDRIKDILANVPVHQVDDAHEAKARHFDCQTWVQDAFEHLLEEQAICGRIGSWEQANAKTLEYLDTKRAQKRWDRTWEGGVGVPLMDLLEGREVVQWPLPTEYCALSLREGCQAARGVVPQLFWSVEGLEARCPARHLAGLSGLDISHCIAFCMPGCHQ